VPRLKTTERQPHDFKTCNFIGAKPRAASCEQSPGGRPKQQTAAAGGDIERSARSSARDCGCESKLLTIETPYNPFFCIE
jgi:hypothetical protein